jgi:hypothetical protein
VKDVGDGLFDNADYKFKEWKEKIFSFSVSVTEVT